MQRGPGTNGARNTSNTSMTYLGILEDYHDMKTSSNGIPYTETVEYQIQHDSCFVQSNKESKRLNKAGTALMHSRGGLVVASQLKGDIDVKHHSSCACTRSLCLCPTLCLRTSPSSVSLAPATRNEGALAQTLAYACLPQPSALTEDLSRPCPIQ